VGIDQHDYPLGYSEDEARRLAAQAALFEDLTEDMLRRADLHAGMQVRAGVPRPTMIAAARVESGPQSPAYEYATAILRSLLPLIERSGIATAEQIGIETLADRLRHDAVANDRVTFLPRLVSAWSRLPA
jgi:hypothetical protein